jgi:uncharacterized membrane protein YphA (DoxX/SURF4 family)
MKIFVIFVILTDSISNYSETMHWLNETAQGIFVFLGFVSRLSAFVFAVFPFHFSNII